MGGAVRRGLLLVAVAVACTCALAPAAYATLSVPDAGRGTPFFSLAGFTSASGGADNGIAAGEQGSGFRHATWDQLALDGSDPGSTTIVPGNVIAPAPTGLEPWGLELGPEIAVANDGFHSVNSSAFAPFSAPNVWGTFNTNVAGLQVVVPAGQGTTPTPAQTRGVGIVFLGAGGSTQIQYYNGDILLGSVLPPSSTTTSFAGLLFPDPVVTRVVVTLGDAQMFGFDGAMPPMEGGPSATAGDDIVLAEPGPKLQTTAGVPISPVLDTFTNTESHATATIDWGDGARTAGTIGPLGGGTFDVTGTHAYAEAGSYTATVTVRDFAGNEQVSHSLIEVAARASTTSLSCSPSPVAVTAATACTVTVADAGPGVPVSPTGTVAFSSPTAGAEFDEDGGCVLGPDGSPGVASCQVQFTPSRLPPVQAKVDVVYGGDGAHAASEDSAIVQVRPQRCTLKALPAKLNRRPAILAVIVTCDARANVSIAVKAVAARKRPFEAFSRPFGSVRAAVSQGRPTVLVIKPPASVVGLVRAAARRHQHVSLKLTLTATSHSARSTTTTRVAALRTR